MLLRLKLLHLLIGSPSKDTHLPKNASYKLSIQTSYELHVPDQKPCRYMGMDREIKRKKGGE